MRECLLVALAVGASLGFIVAPAGCSPATSAPSAGARENQRSDSNNNSNNSRCQYERSQWSGCKLSGMQQRTLRLKESAMADRCELKRIVRRECRPGCKYQRGQWSELCKNGRRVRVDTLLEPVPAPGAAITSSGKPAGAAAAATATCSKQRRVIKDCRRTCHYSRSAWSECSAGLKERNLTLIAGGASCKASRNLKRPC